MNDDSSDTTDTGSEPESTDTPSAATAPPRMGKGPAFVMVLALAALFGTILWVWPGADVRELIEGEPAVVTSAGGCVEGGINTGTASYCSADWRFADGSTGSGRIGFSSAHAGESIYAGEDWAAGSKGGLIAHITLKSLIVLAGVIPFAIEWVGNIRSSRRERGKPQSGPDD